MINTFQHFLCALLFTTIQFIVVGQMPNKANIVIERDGLLLQGTFHVAQGTGKPPTVIMLNGFPGGKTDVIGMGKLLSEKGINVLTFQYCGTYESQGLSGFDNQQKDVQAAFDFIRQPENISRFQIDTNLVYLGGWCHGGGMALAYSVNHPEITSVFTIVGNDFGEFMRQYVQSPDMKTIVDEMHVDLISKGTIRMDKGASPAEMAEAGVENLNPIFDIRKNARALAQKDMLLVCGWDDEYVTVDQFMLPLYREIKKENPENLQIIALQDGHSFLHTRKVLAEHIAEWILEAPGRKQ